MNALILAAGLGERLKPHTLKIAKPAIPLLNVPMLGYPLFFLERAGLKNLVINTHHLPKTIEAAAKSLVSNQYSLAFSHEPEILASGGGLAQASKMFSGTGDILFVNSDAVFFTPESNPVEKLMRTHRETGALATILLTPFAPWQREFGGVYVDDNHVVRQFSKTEISDSLLKAYHFAGMIVCSHKFYSKLQVRPTNILYDDLQPLIDAGARVAAHIDYNMSWFETGSVEHYLAATRAVLELLSVRGEKGDQARGILTRFTPGWDNFKVGDIYSYGKLSLKSTARGLVGRGAQVHSSAVLRDFAVVGANSVVPAECSVHGSVIGPDVKVDSTHLENEILV